MIVKSAGDPGRQSGGRRVRRERQSFGRASPAAARGLAR
jgi:hypothetical protein